MRFSNTSESKRGNKAIITTILFSAYIFHQAGYARACTETFFECSVLVLGTAARRHSALRQDCTRVELFFESSVTTSVARACTEVFFSSALWRWTMGRLERDFCRHQQLGRVIGMG